MAVVIAIAFALIIPVQTIVFVSAPIAGVIIGGYANNRSARWRPMRRVFLNAAWAGFVTGLTLAIMYIVLRLLFVFADTGTMPNGSTLSCSMGPDCTYQRYAQDPTLAPYLAEAGITDGPSMGAAVIHDQLDGRPHHHPGGRRWLGGRCRVPVGADATVEAPVAIGSPR